MGTITLGFGLAAFAGAAVVELVAWVLIVRRKRLDLVDVFWGLAFLGAMAGMYVYSPHGSAVQLLVDAMVGIWAVRLSVHIGRRFARSSVQDVRYTELSAAWPKRYRAGQLLIKICLVQAVLAAVVSLPLVTVHSALPSLSILTAIGVLLWGTGFALEATADKQLSAFVKHNADPQKVLDTGLWRYSRHPNYFGEIVLWWGVACLALGTNVWWLGLIGAAAITYLITFVSGVPLSEKRMARRGGWQAYAAHTSKLVPLPKHRTK